MTQQQIKEQIERAATDYVKPIRHQLPLGGEQSVIDDFTAGATHVLEHPELYGLVAARKPIHPMALAVAHDMTFELDTNKGKGDWIDWKDIFAMVYELVWHQSKLMYALHSDDLGLIREHIADMANILMFIGNAKDLYPGAKDETIEKGWNKINEGGK